MRSRLHNPSISIDEVDFSGGAAWIVVHQASHGDPWAWDLEVRPTAPGNPLHRALLAGRDTPHPLLIRTSDTVRWFEGRVIVSGMGMASHSVACVGMGPLHTFVAGETFVGRRGRFRA